MTRARDFADLAGSADAGGLTGRNLVINGAMQVSQRGTSETGITSSQYADAPDRFRLGMYDSGTWTVSQSTTSPNGFSNSYKMDCTTAKSTLASDSNIQFMQRFEGQNLQSLAKGTSDAKSVTVSFYVRTNKTGTYTLEMFDRDNTRVFSKTYTVSSANTWEFKSVTFAGDTSGAFTNDANLSMDLIWWLAAGTDLTSGTFSSGWASKTDANRVSSSQVNLADSTSNEWYITGIQLEVGEQATPFEHRSFADELQRCQRYYAVRENTTGGSMYYGNTLQAYGTSSIYGVIADYPVTMRAVPTVSQSGTFGAYYANSGNNGMATTIGGLSATSHAWRTNGWSGNSNFTAGDASVLFANDGAKLMADAEL